MRKNDPVTTIKSSGDARRFARYQLEDLLLQLEAALGLASPADVQAARRDMKLRAMKAALEGRSAKQPPPPTIDALTHAALRHAHPDPTQRDRLHAILAALRSHEISPP